ncbi:hypothetical protein H2248_004935 [Termitomyces sp. 'cryptogamus']|nr:hypothetical protein H2248_004935 [Termitomyces sp. 'cryptogamus']
MSCSSNIISQQDIRYIDFAALKAAGYRGAVFDKDNCITRPHKDTIVPEIQQAWDECRKTFGEGNVLIVSNSAGTWLDPGGIQCESVTHNTGVPVLRHKTFKPAYSCITTIRAYFSSLQFPIRDEELIVVGDRIFTDIVMTNRMRRWKKSRMTLTCGEDTVGKEKDASKNQPQGPLSIWTTGIWQQDSRVMRWGEQKLVDVVRRWTHDPVHTLDTSGFIREILISETQPGKRNRVLAALLAKFKTG